MSRDLPTGFQDDGERVPAVDFVYPEAVSPVELAEAEIAAVRQETTIALLDFITSDAVTTEQIAGRVLALAYGLRWEHSPVKSVRELAGRLGISVGKAHTLIMDVRRLANV